MALFRYPGSKNWWYEFRFDGRRIRESTKSQSKTLARDAERVRRRELEEAYNAITRKQLPPTFAAAAEDLLKRKTGVISESSLEMLKAAIRRVSPTFGNKLVNEISAEEMKAYQNRLLAGGAPARTINMDLAPVRSVLIRHKCWDNVRQDFRMLPVPESQGLALSQAEELKLLSACKASRSRSLFTIVLVALCTGMRRSEIRYLQWFQVNLTNRTITVGKSKTRHGTGRVVPVNNRLHKALFEWAIRFPNRLPDHYVFPFERYGCKSHLFHERTSVPYRTDPTKPFGHWKTAWVNAKKRCGIKCRFHDLRHTAATRMLEAGTSLSVVGSIMGWCAATTAGMAKRYGHMSDEAKAKAVRAMDAPERNRHRQRKKHADPRRRRNFA